MIANTSHDSVAETTSELGENGCVYAGTLFKGTPERSHNIAVAVMTAAHNTPNGHTCIAAVAARKAVMPNTWRKPSAESALVIKGGYLGVKDWIVLPSILVPSVSAGRDTDETFLKIDKGQK